MCRSDELAGGGPDEVSGHAREIVANRSHSPVGVLQRHYELDPALVTSAGVCTGVVAIAGSKATYIYPSDADGEIADYAPLGITPPGTCGEVTLAVMGYAVFDGV